MPAQTVTAGVENARPGEPAGVRIESSVMPQAPAILDREEYVEQAYFFRVVRERLAENLPAQEVLRTVHEEILASTKLPLAIELMATEAEHAGRMSGAMRSLGHYFAPFQTFVIAQAEADETKLDMQTALLALEREAEYRSGEATAAGLFIYQFEVMSRNVLGYDDGMKAIAADPLLASAVDPEGRPLGEAWHDWVMKLRHQLGAVDFAEMIYLRSGQRVRDVCQRLDREGGDGAGYEPSFAVLFDERAGRIAKANRGRDPLYMFAALQRQLDYPTVPHPQRKPARPPFEPHVELRFQRLEAKLLVVENELKDSPDLSAFLPAAESDPSK